jgi:hypothetical protein
MTTNRRFTREQRLRVEEFLTGCLEELSELNRWECRWDAQQGKLYVQDLWDGTRHAGATMETDH